MGISDHLRFLHSQPLAIVVASASRTPWGKYKGQLASLNAWQLGKIAVETAIKRSAIPLEQIHCIFMNETPKLQKENSKFIFSNFIKRVNYTSVAVDAETPKMESFLKAVEYIRSHPLAAVVVGGLVSATNNETIEISYKEMAKSFAGASYKVETSGSLENYISESILRYAKSQADAIFDSELVPLKVQHQQGKFKIIKEITQDEIMSKYSKGEDITALQNCDGAAAVVLTTFKNAEQLKLTPLAVIKAYVFLNNTSDAFDGSRKCVEQLFTKVDLKLPQIHHWEIEDSIPQLVDFLKQTFNLNVDLINPHGGSFILGHSLSTSLTRLLTHITHTLNPLEYGCVVCSCNTEAMALIVQKLSPVSIPNRLPLITLYTKNVCSLCDILVEELELHFSGEYVMEKVYIDSKDNIRFLRLYRYDIPVVFLNNQFLCMHRLNNKLLRKRLNLLKNTTS